MFGPLNYYRTSKFRHDEELGKSYTPFIYVIPLYTYTACSLWPWT